ncbi:unnamed protein product [Caenorhabditis angaria]|uniref:Uncharacterized protein n=1 Tax=Caenorhabditis angaria TaxID=860376 RepID=A0A9P1II03_9PELO|nr:unnamed protein product [Caenorhabditis angaria]
MEEVKSLFKDHRWTSDYFAAVIGKYVSRSKIPKEFLNELAKESPGVDVELQYMVGKLAPFFKESGEMRAYYESPEKLLCCLQIYQYFHRSSKYFGDGMNYQNGYMPLVQQKHAVIKHFVSKHDVISGFFTKSSIPNCFVDNFKKQSLDILGKCLDNSFEMIAKKDFERNYARDFKKLKGPKESTDRILQEHSEIFEGNPEVVRGVLTNLCDWDYSHEQFFYNSEWFHEKYPIIRVFQDFDDQLMFLARDLENILDILMKKTHNKPFIKGLIRVENEEDQKNGVMRTYRYSELEKLLRICRLNSENMEKIICEINFFARFHHCPIPTPQGTFCKLAAWSFYEIFDEICFGMDLFKAIDWDDVEIVVKWFEKWFDSGVFDTKRSYRYFIETWKLEEIVDNAYLELEKLKTQEFYKLPLKKTNFSKEEALEIMERLTENVDEDEKIEENYENLIEIHFSRNVKHISARQIVEFYNEIIYNFLVRRIPRIPIFLEIQGRIDIFGSDLRKSLRISFEEYIEIFQESFINCLPKMPLEAELTELEMIAYTRRGMGEYGAMGCMFEEEEPETIELSKFMHCFVERVPKNSDIYVRPVAIFRKDPVLRELFENSDKVDVAEVPGIIKARLEKLLEDSEEGVVIRKLSDMIENIKKTFKKLA